MKRFLLVFVIIISSVPDIYSQWYSLGFQGYGNKSAPTVVSHNNALLLTDNNWTNFGLLRSGSNSWEIVNGTKSRFVSILKLDDDLIFFGNAEGIYKYKPGGTIELVDNALMYKKVNSLKLINNRIYAASYDGVYVGNNSQLTDFVYRINGLGDKNVVDIANSGTRVFAITDMDGIFYSDNEGITWQSCNTGIDNMSLYSIAANSTTVCVGSSTKIYVSGDKGKSWQSLNPGNKQALVTKLENIGNVFVAATSQGVYVSKDNAKSWSDISGAYSGDFIHSMCLTANELVIGIANKGFLARQLQNVVSVEPETDSEYEVYPNPCDDFVRISSESRDINSIEIIDLQGSRVHLANNWQNGEQLDTSKLPPGTYILIINNQKRIKLIKK